MNLTSLLLLVTLSTPIAALSQAPPEAAALAKFEARESHRPAYDPNAPSKFKPSDHVFIQSALALDFTYRKATATLPLFRGLDSSGDSVYYILTDASDFAFARALDINYAPKLRKAAGSPGAQTATIKDGLITFKGKVDFSPVYKVVPGSPDPFPPAVADPGAVADADWSSIVELPSGIVINAQIVDNKTGTHDRLKSVDIKNRTVTLSILDGTQGGRQYFYHLVTDASASLPAVLEKGVFAPRLSEVRDAIDTITSKVVLILGRFTKERKAVLDMFREKLRDRNLLPVIFDFEGPRSRDLTETVSTLAHIARFIIADITDAKSIPQELTAIVPHLPSVPVQPIQLVSQREYGMFEHFKRFPWVYEIRYYSDLSGAAEAVDETIARAMADTNPIPNH